jgi:hypothetical protein
MLKLVFEAMQMIRFLIAELLMLMAGGANATDTENLYFAYSCFFDNGVWNSC